MTSRYHRIRDILEAAFDPSRMEIVDESAKHANHAGATSVTGARETHYYMVLVSNAFTGLSRVARARAVHEALDVEFRSGLHSLTFTLRTPAEDILSCGLN